MIALLIVLAGFCFMFGARDAAKRLLAAAFGLVILVEILDSALAELSAFTSGIARALGSSHLFLMGVSLALCVIGYAAWRTRGARAAKKQEDRRRNGAPRERAVSTSMLRALDEDGVDL
jgi:hypothetical protein